MCFAPSDLDKTDDTIDPDGLNNADYLDDSNDLDDLHPGRLGRLGHPGRLGRLGRPGRLGHPGQDDDPDNHD
jgi:hypothetical protein